jgi:hypothetical protein
VVVGGNIARASAHFWDSTGIWLENFDCPVKMSMTQLGETASLTGAAGIFTGEETDSMKEGKTFF